MENPIVSNVVAVGRPILPEIKVTLTGRNELVIEGNLSNGYLNSLNPLSCFHTGDSGFCHDGVWYVTGRVDDVVKINGHFVSPVQVETCFTQVFSEPCAAAIVNMSVYALVESNRFVFEREIMRDSGIPWHLIPKRVFFIPTIPKQGGGAGKVDCASVKQIIEDFLNTTTASVSDDKDPLVSILSSVLGVTVELDKSFVEMGGDSALAITLLYKLRMAGLASVDVPVADILESMNVQNLSDILSGDVVPKRRKVLQQVDSMEPFVVQDIKRFSDCHFAIEFKACVDASPLVNGTDVFGACQGGIIQKIACHKVVACHQLTGWQVQAGMIIVNDLLIVCGYNNDGESGIIVALTLDLRMTKWARHVQGQIKSTPIVMRDQLWVVAGAMLIILDPVDGKEISSLQFPSKTESRPAVCIGLSCVVYGFADWDTGLGIVNDMGTLITTVHAENVSPVYADLLQLDSKRVAVCDIRGVIHDFNIDSLEIKSTRVASKPIFSGPIQVDDSVIFGCHDGIVRCIKASNFSEKLWEYDAQSVVYSSPLAVPGDCFVVCTTAGDIIQIRKGTEEWRMMVPGEIWSNPIIIGVGGNIAVGARDSRVHIIRQITNGPV
jgi:outer membrane protein assembly factor BamB